MRLYKKAQHILIICLFASQTPAAVRSVLGLERGQQDLPDREADPPADEPGAPPQGRPAQHFLCVAGQAHGVSGRETVELQNMPVRTLQKHTTLYLDTTLSFSLNDHMTDLLNIFVSVCMKYIFS